MPHSDLCSYCNNCISLQLSWEKSVLLRESKQMAASGKIESDGFINLHSAVITGVPVITSVPISVNKVKAIAGGGGL